MFPGSKLHTDLAATKAALQAVHGPRILHLPTHGYFGAQDCRGNATHADNPLVAAGLALAGANACDAGDDRQGIVTGEELAGLDLHGNELVVLSACDTGLGKLDITDNLSTRTSASSASAMACTGCAARSSWPAPRRSW